MLFGARWTISFRPSTRILSRSSSLKGKLESSVSFVGRYILGERYSVPADLACFLATANLVTIFLTNLLRHHGVNDQGNCIMKGY